MSTKFIAAQVGATSFVDEGTEEVLDTLQELGGVNVLFLVNYTYTTGSGGRQIPNQPFADHGPKEYTVNFVGGHYSTAHSKYYRQTFIDPDDFHAPEHNDFDLLAEVTPAARRRGMKVFNWIEESPGWAQAKTIPNYGLLLEKDVIGRRGTHPCFNNPDYRNWQFGLIEDSVKSYDVDGVIWCSERQGPLGNLLGDPMWSTGATTCFCDHCIAKAVQQGINPDRARQGYLELQEFISKSRKDVRPTDGYFVSFWRLLLKYPEIMAWENLWHEGQRQFFREIYGIVKAIDPNVLVGWHVFHMNSFSPFYRATQDIGDMSHYSDFIKLVTYNNCAGPRFAAFMDNLHKTIFHDATPEESLQMMYKFLGIQEGLLSEIKTQGWSSHYVRKETERAIRAVKEAGNSTMILPGIDIDIPTGEGLKQTEPSDVFQAVTAAFEGGANGVVLSKKYAEMKLPNLAAAGRAIKQWYGN